MPSLVGCQITDGVVNIVNIMIGATLAILMRRLNDKIWNSQERWVPLPWFAVFIGILGSKSKGRIILELHARYAMLIDFLNLCMEQPSPQHLLANICTTLVLLFSSPVRQGFCEIIFTVPNRILNNLPTSNN